ncbi:MAG: hypothetical protein ABI675_02615 [Chitinophagaceae bacterium]
MKGGVLIIGSLLWDKHQGKHLNARQNWRNKRLEFNKRIHAFAPIRYGRKSGKGVYTMVFSKLVEINDNWGTVYFVPFKKAINTFQGIFNQARYLSNAEGAEDKNLVKGNGEKWCVIGILFNPTFNKESKMLLLNKFQQKLNEENLNEEYLKFCIPPEVSILSFQGEININWPKASNPKNQEELNSYDFIIATCPKQNIESYPDPATIKAAVLNDKRNYFYNNLLNGITTFQDREIISS